MIYAVVQWLRLLGQRRFRLSFVKPSCVDQVHSLTLMFKRGDSRFNSRQCASSLLSCVFHSLLPFCYVTEPLVTICIAYRCDWFISTVAYFCVLRPSPTLPSPLTLQSSTSRLRFVHGFYKICCLFLCALLSLRFVFIDILLVGSYLSRWLFYHF
jgi:hypothetical protein